MKSECREGLSKNRLQVIAADSGIADNWRNGRASKRVPMLASPNSIGRGNLNEGGHMTNVVDSDAVAVPLVQFNQRFPAKMTLPGSFLER
jgi:hypothetical protein